MDVDRPEPSAEAKRFCTLSYRPTRHRGPARKLALLNKQDRAYVLDELTQKAADKAQAVLALASIIPEVLHFQRRKQS